MKQAKILTQKQLNLFFKQLEIYPNAKRNRLIIAFTFFGGLRIGEVTKLFWKDVVDINYCVKDEIILLAENTKAKETQKVFINKKLRNCKKRIKRNRTKRGWYVKFFKRSRK